MILFEDDVVAFLAEHLRNDGWEIESIALSTQHGDDLVASRNGERLIVEAKGEGSSKSHTANFGSPFTKQQASKHIANAVLRALRVASEGSAIAAIALPAAPCHRHEVSLVAPSLAKAGVRVYWIEQDGTVSVQG